MDHVDTAAESASALATCRLVLRHDASIRWTASSRNSNPLFSQKARDHRSGPNPTFGTNLYSTSKAMFFTLLLVIFFPLATFTASISQLSQSTASVAPDSLLTLNPTDDSSLEPIESDSSLIIQSIGSPQSPNTTLLLPNASLSVSEYDMPFEYPGLDDLLGATNAGLQCKGESFGFNLSRTSCVQAFGRIGTSANLVTWGQRARGNYQVKLPYRYSSFDGFCAIDVVHSRNTVSEVASEIQIKRAAAQIMNGCIRNGAPNTGGMIGNVGMLTAEGFLRRGNHRPYSPSTYTFSNEYMRKPANTFGLGQNRNLVVVIRLYIPKVTCGFGGALAPYACDAVLDIMPVATEQLVFGKAGDPATRVIIPRSFVAGEHDFVLSLRFYLSTDLDLPFPVIDFGRLMKC